jgi:hypothetical protein
MDNWWAIAPMLIGFHQTAPQKLAKAKELVSAWKPPGTAPNPSRGSTTGYHNDG